MAQPQNAQQITLQWLQRLKDSAARYRAGVNAVVNSPMEAAAAQEQYWAQRVAEAARTNRFSAGLRRVTLATWKQMASTVGADRIAALPDNKATKTLAFWQRFLPFLQSVTARVQQMPRQTYEQRRARAIAMMDGLHDFRAQNANQQPNLGPFFGQQPQLG